MAEHCKSTARITAEAGWRKNVSEEICDGSPEMPDEMAELKLNLILPRLKKSSHDLASRLQTMFNLIQLDLVARKSLEVDLSRLKSWKSAIT
jgi:hypothetical protein